MSDANKGTYPPVLQGLRVLDLSHQYSGLLAATLMADLGADVTVVEHPKGSPIRSMLPRIEGESMWWKSNARGKRAVSLDLSTAQGRTTVLEMARHVDVVVENFRPGTLERWDLSPADFEAAGADLVMLRISGFGQTGPMRERPGFGTAAEAMSGFAFLTGEPGGSPVFSSTTLADGVTAVFGAFGVMAALVARRSGNASPAVEVVDAALFESLFRIIPTQVQAYDQTGKVPQRMGNSLFAHGTLRNLYTSGDGLHFIVASVGAQTIRRILVAIGAEDLAEQTEARTAAPAKEVEAFLNECDARIKAFSADKTFEQIGTILSAHGAVFQKVYSMEDIVNDPQYAARGDLIRVPDPKLGDILMPGVMPKFVGRTHTPQQAGKSIGEDNDSVFQEMFPPVAETVGTRSGAPVT